MPYKKHFWFPEEPFLSFIVCRTFIYCGCWFFMEPYRSTKNLCALKLRMHIACNLQICPVLSVSVYCQYVTQSAIYKRQKMKQGVTASAPDGLQSWCHANSMRNLFCIIFIIELQNVEPHEGILFWSQITRSVLPVRLCEPSGALLWQREGCHGNIKGGYPGNCGRHGDCITGGTNMRGVISQSLISS